MYRSDLGTRDKSGALAVVVAVHAGLLFMLLQLSGQIDLTDPQSVLKTFDVTDPPPPRTIPPPPRPADKAKPKQKEGGSSPKNIKSEATPVTAPKPRVAPLIPNPVVVAETPRQGAQSTQGASDVRGPGTGSGGFGTGTGSGNGGSGPGGGGGGGAAVPPALIRGITSRDYPTAIRQSWPRGAGVFLRLRIEANGRPSRCDVMRGFGNPSADQWTCTLVMQRGVFRPARDSAGRPVAAWFGYKQSDRDF
jgi:protein TonB